MPKATATAAAAAACCSPDPGLDAPAAPIDTPQADAELAAFTKALSHPVRVRIVRMLARRQARTCSRIVDELPLAQSTVSEHLRILRASGLVRVNDSGPQVGYCIVPSALVRLKSLLAAL